MRKQRSVVMLGLVTMLAWLLMACGNVHEPSEGEHKLGNPSEPVMVEFVTAADSLEPNKDVKLQVKVTQGGNAVSDADEVIFEIWKEGNKEGAEKIPAHHEGDGIYSIAYRFPESGNYEVIAHVTARGMHTMPQQTFHVGGVTKENGQQADEHQADDQKQMEQGHHQHGSGDLSIDFKKPDGIRANQEVKLTARLQKAKQPLTGAEVTFEYWRNGEKKHTYLETTEVEPGTYQAKVAFEKPGSFQVKIHVKKGELHEHQESTIHVH
ncbi:MAG: hypothetical protein BAA01_00315 [Bacillus thermozeamaize]|uniref:YtkA-like domain-containing protein n=1 Tax=Bacillus thermozeamaize TaxID=230954 RepID=A0A1Y3Q2Z3_9BACI|nr:MAG: hypothetical protein BAA01_00315 [Bacillus thermozeamaize]